MVKDDLELRLVQSIKAHLLLAQEYQAMGNRDASYKLNKLVEVLEGIWHGVSKTFLPPASKSGRRADRDNRKTIIRQILADAKAGRSCMDCARDDVQLTWDHRDRSQKKFDLSNCASKGKTNKQVMDEIAKCDLVCRPCHVKREQKRDREILNEARKKVVNAARNSKVSNGRPCA